MNKTIQFLSAILAGTAGLLFGNINGILFALIIFIIFDYISGVLVAISRKKLSSAVGFKGIAKKATILIIVAVGHIIGIYVLNCGDVCRDMVIGFYLANEGISILENAAKLGLPLPEKLVEILAQLKNDKK